MYTVFLVSTELNGHESEPDNGARSGGTELFLQLGQLEYFKRTAKDADSSNHEVVLEIKSVRIV